VNEIEKNIIFSKHSLDQIRDRGTNEEEVKMAIEHGEIAPAKKGRIAFRKNFEYNKKWKNKFYQTKQVMPIVIHEKDAYIVVTVYVFFIGGK
jgi:hypothetical protein